MSGATTRIYTKELDRAKAHGKQLLKVDVADGVQIRVSVERLERNVQLARTSSHRVGQDAFEGEYIDVPLTWLIGERVGY